MVKGILQNYVNSLLYTPKSRQMVRIYYVNSQLEYQDVLINSTSDSLSNEIDRVIYGYAFGNYVYTIVPAIVASWHVKAWLLRRSKGVGLQSGKEILIFYLTEERKVYQLNEFISMQLNVPDILMEQIRSDCFLRLINIDNEPVDRI